MSKKLRRTFSFPDDELQRFHLRTPRIRKPPIMFNRTTILFYSTLLVTLLHADGLLAQKNNANQRDERRENERVSKAEKHLREVRQDLERAQKEAKSDLQKLNAAQDAVQKAKRALREAEETAEDEIGEKLGIPTAIKKVKDASEQKQVLCEPILAQLHATESWINADREAESATQQKTKLREDVTLDDTKRNEALKKLEVIINRPFELEQKTLLSNPNCAKAIENVTKLQLELTNLRKSISRDQVAANPKVTKARKALEAQASTLKSAEKELASSQSKLGKAQKQYESAETELAKARAADAADSNRNKKGGR